MSFLTSCTEFETCEFSKQTKKVAVKHCNTQHWDTIEVPIDARLKIYNFKTAVPELIMFPTKEEVNCINSDVAALNICEFNIIDKQL
jgi:hypothetical protein